MKKPTKTDLYTIAEILQTRYQSAPAPIMDLIAVQTHDPYRILVGTILSARTKDQVTAQACAKLFDLAPDLDHLATLSEAQIAQAIYPVGFYPTKAKHLHQLPAVIATQFGGKIPQSLDALCQLPGVGRKTANLVLILAFNLPGICVDTHVHRINNRLQIVTTESPLDTEMALRKKLPPDLWQLWNAIFVSFGQTHCTPRNPKCATCPLHAAGLAPCWDPPHTQD